MEHLQQQEEEMRGSLREMGATINSLRDFTNEVETLLARWAERVERVGRIQESGWKHAGNQLEAGAVASLESLRETARKRVARDEERLESSRRVLAELEERFSSLQKAAKNFSVYLTLNSIETSSESSGVTPDVIELMEESRKLSSKANAFIEIEAGKNV